jgi:hypothetical protein
MHLHNITKPCICVILQNQNLATGRSSPPKPIKYDPIQDFQILYTVHVFIKFPIWPRHVLGPTQKMSTGMPFSRSYNSTIPVGVTAEVYIKSLYGFSYPFLIVVRKKL